MTAPRHDHLADVQRMRGLYGSRRDAAAIIAELHDAAGALLELARTWRTMPPTPPRIEDADRLLHGLRRLLGELREGRPTDG